MTPVQIPLDRLEDNPWQTRHSYDEEHVERVALSVLQHSLQQVPHARLTSVGGEALEVTDEDALTDQDQVDQLFATREDARAQLAFGHNRRRAFELIEKWIVQGHRPPRPQEREELAKSGETVQVPMDEDDLPDELAAGFMPVRLEQYSDEEMADLAWAENDDRKDLTPIDEAMAIRQRMEDFGMTQSDVAEHLGLARSTVSNKLRMMKLDDYVLDLVAEGRLSERAAAATVPYFELEEEKRELVDSFWIDNLLDAIEDNPEDLKSGRARELVRNGLSAPDQIEDKRFPADYRFETLDWADEEKIVSSTCEGCPMSYEYKGHRCGDWECAKEKERAWDRKKTIEVANDLGVPVLDDDVYTGTSPFSDYTDGAEEGLEHALETECENLTLRPGETWASSEFQPDGCEAQFVCHHGENNVCECMQQMKEEEKAEREEAEAKIERMNEHIKDQVRNRIGGYTTKELALLSGKARNVVDWEEDSRVPKEELIEEIAERAVNEYDWLVDFDDRYDFEEHKRIASKYFDLIGIDIEVCDPSAPSEGAGTDTVDSTSSAATVTDVSSPEVIALNEETVRALAWGDLDEDLKTHAPVSALVVATWLAPDEREHELATAIHRRTGESNVALVYTSMGDELQNQMTEIQNRCRQDEKTLEV